MRACARTHVSVLQTRTGTGHSNNGTVMRLPFFRDNQWGPLSRRVTPTVVRARGDRGPMPLKRTIAFLFTIWPALPFSFFHPSLPLSFAFSTGPCVFRGPRRPPRRQRGTPTRTGPFENPDRGTISTARSLARSTARGARPPHKFFMEFPLRRRRHKFSPGDITRRFYSPMVRYLIGIN